MTQEDSEKVATEFIKARLIDPYYARFTFSRVVPYGYVYDKRLGTYYGSKLIVLANAKNRFGGYVGNTEVRFLFRNGRLAHAWRVNDQWENMDKLY